MECASAHAPSLVASLPSHPHDQLSCIRRCAMIRTILSRSRWSADVKERDGHPIVWNFETEAGRTPLAPPGGCR
jgi:hypothetical protein